MRAVGGRVGGAAAAGDGANATGGASAAFRVFRDVVFQDVGFEDNSFNPLAQYQL